MESYCTLAAPCEGEIIEKKSRFIARIAPVASEEEALAFIEEVRAANRMARHNVYAYILHQDQGPARERFTDDGEPSKTAGLPVLDVLRHENLQDVCCVVTRYFGGILLGTGGLVRAYTQATQEALSHGDIRSLVRCIDVSVQTAYSLYEPAVRLAESTGAKVVDSSFGEQVALTFRIPEGQEILLTPKLVELLRGAPVQVSEPFDAAF